MLDGICRHEGEAQSRRNHRKGPVVALAPIGGRAGDALLLQNLICVTGELTIYAMDVVLAVHLPHRKRPLVSEAVTAMHGEHHLLTKKRNGMGSLIGLLTRQRVDHGFEVPASKRARKSLAFASQSFRSTSG